MGLMSVLMHSFHCRYDHYGTLCELLPAGIPSLVFCLKAVDEGTFFPVKKMVVSLILGSINIKYMGQIEGGTSQ